LKNKQSIKAIFLKNEISIKELWNIFLDRKKIILGSISIFFIIGLIAAFTNPVEYEARCILLTDNQGSNNQTSGTLMGLANLAGVSVTQDPGIISGPILYNIILTSRPFFNRGRERTFKN